MRSDVSALIVATPSRTRDSLCALLKAIPHLKIVDLADDGPSALGMITTYHPALVLIDSTFPDNELQGMLQKIKAEESQTRSLVLVNNTRQQAIAEAAGADSILLTGFPATKLFSTIEGLLLCKNSKKEPSVG